MQFIATHLAGGKMKMAIRSRRLHCEEERNERMTPPENTVIEDGRITAGRPKEKERKKTCSFFSRSPIGNWANADRERERETKRIYMKKASSAVNNDERRM